MEGNQPKKEASRRTYEALKRQVLEHYSPPVDKLMKARCAVCGEKDLAVLQLHHKSGDSSEEHKTYGYGNNYLYSLQRRGYPEGLDVLCANCRLKLRHTV